MDAQKTKRMKMVLSLATSFGLAITTLSSNDNQPETEDGPIFGVQ